MNKTFGGYLDEVSFIGQPAFFAEPEVPNLTKENCIGTRFSPHTHFTKGSGVYKACKNFLRDWYTNTFDDFFVKHYFNKINVNEEQLTEACIDCYTYRSKIEKGFFYGLSVKNNFDEVKQFVSDELTYFSKLLTHLSGTMLNKMYCEYQNNYLIIYRRK